MLNECDMDQCVICKIVIEDKSKASALRLKGCSLKEAAKKRNEQIKVLPGDFVHKECRKQYTNPNVIKRNKKEDNSENPGTGGVARGRRSLDTKFSFKHDCLFCGRPAKYDGKRKGYDV